MLGNSSQVRPSRTRPLRPGGPDRRRVRAVCQGTDQTLQRAGRPDRTPWVGPEKSAFPHPTRSADQTEPPAALDPSADPIGRAEAQRVEKTIAKAEGLEICPSPQDRALNGRHLLADAQSNEPLTPLVPLSPGEARGKSERPRVHAHAKPGYAASDRRPTLLAGCREVPYTGRDGDGASANGRGFPRARLEGTRLGLHDVPSPGIHSSGHLPELRPRPYLGNRRRSRSRRST